MERRKALIASAVIALTLTTGAAAYAAGSGVLSGRTDNVGNLQPVATQPTDITVYLDPATGAVTTTAPPVATADPIADPNAVPSAGTAGDRVDPSRSDHGAEPESGESDD